MTHSPGSPHPNVDLLLQGNLDVLSDTLDVTSDLLARFGNVMSGYHSHLKAAILPHLEEPRPVVRKRAILSMGTYAASKQTVSLSTNHNCQCEMPLLGCSRTIFWLHCTDVLRI